MSLDEALQGKDIPTDIREQLALLPISFWSFAGEVEEGHLVVHQALAGDVTQIFAALRELRFPIAKMVPVAAYDWDDDRSMADNNTSAFNYRVIVGQSRLSTHAYGRALDINPVQNPYIRADGKVLPPGARYEREVRGTVTPEIAEIFKSRGFTWGGDWQDPKDWQHFEKTN